MGREYSALIIHQSAVPLTSIGLKTYGNQMSVGFLCESEPRIRVKVYTKIPRIITMLFAHKVTPMILYILQGYQILDPVAT